MVSAQITENGTSVLDLDFGWNRIGVLGTFASASITFQVNDGLGWVPVEDNSGAITATSAKAFDMVGPGQIRATTASATGSTAVTFYVQALPKS